MEEPNTGACGLLLPTLPTHSIKQSAKDRESTESLYKENPRGKRKELLGEAEDVKDELPAEKNGKV